MEEPRDPPIDAATDRKYVLLVGGLLVAIVVLLAALWLRERRISLTARREVIALRRKAVLRGPLGGAFGRLLGGRPGPKPLARGDLPAETVTWNGRPQVVFRISPAAGERMGLRPGDVVWVAQVPTTAPAK